MVRKTLQRKWYTTHSSENIRRMKFQSGVSRDGNVFENFKAGPLDSEKFISTLKLLQLRLHNTPILIIRNDNMECEAIETKYPKIENGNSEDLGKEKRILELFYSVSPLFDSLTCIYQQGFSVSFLSFLGSN